MECARLLDPDANKELTKLSLVLEYARLLVCRGRVQDDVAERRAHKDIRGSPTAAA
jgi:hypothetical protein